MAILSKKTDEAYCKYRQKASKQTHVHTLQSDPNGVQQQALKESVSGGRCLSGRRKEKLVVYGGRSGGLSPGGYRRQANSGRRRVPAPPRHRRSFPLFEHTPQAQSIVRGAPGECRAPFWGKSRILRVAETTRVWPLARSVRRADVRDR